VSEGGHGRIGKYDITRKIGEGATSSVWLGRDTFANRDVAIKLVAQAALRMPRAPR
jgi:serine/threonine protein kinase